MRSEEGRYGPMFVFILKHEPSNSWCINSWCITSQSSKIHTSPNICILYTWLSTCHVDSGSLFVLEYNEPKCNYSSSLETRYDCNGFI